MNELEIDSQNVSIKLGKSVWEGFEGSFALN